MFANGQGMPQNDVQAVVLYRKAAEQGFGLAQYHLGGMYGDGRGGLPQDNVEALKWLFLAAAGATGEDLQKFADGLDKRAKMMPPAQVQEATKRALEWTEASKRRLAAQVDAEPKPPALQIAELMVTPRTVRPGQPFSLEIAYTATDPAAASRKAAVNMSLSILSGRICAAGYAWGDRGVGQRSVVENHQAADRGDDSRHLFDPCSPGSRRDGYHPRRRVRDYALTMHTVFMRLQLTPLLPAVVLRAVSIREKVRFTDPSSPSNRLRLPN